MSALDPLTCPSLHQAGPDAVTAMIPWRRGDLQLALPSVGREIGQPDPRMGGPTSTLNVLPVEGYRNQATWAKKAK